MCMESRKMVPMKLFAGQQWRYRQNRLVDTVWEEEGGWTERVASVQFSSVQFSCSVMSNSLLPQGLQHPRPPCPSLSPEFTQTHVHWVGDAIQHSHPLSSSPSAPTLNLSQHQGLFKWVSASHQVTKVLEYSLDDIFRLSRMKLFWYP